MIVIRDVMMENNANLIITLYKYKLNVVGSHARKLIVNNHKIENKKKKLNRFCVACSSYELF